VVSFEDQKFVAVISLVKLAVGINKAVDINLITKWRIQKLHLVYSTKQHRDLQDFPETYSRTFGLFSVYVHCNRIKKAVDILRAKLSK
jgi:hypothetical protein